MYLPGATDQSLSYIIYTCGECSRCRKLQTGRRTARLEKHAPGILDELLDLDEELDCLPAVEQPVVDVKARYIMGRISILPSTQRGAP